MVHLSSTRGFTEYRRRAQEILGRNWTGGYTRPSPGLYPHQWNWDSGFIAMGYAHYHEERARQELWSLFEHQWPSGMLPHIVFNPHALGNYFPEPDFWQAPEGRLTSGITMPPLHATVCLHIYQRTKDSPTTRRFLKQMFSRLMASHRYLYEQRDPDGTGLAAIWHPWESGLDNSPAWDGPLSRIHVDPNELPLYRRHDLKHDVAADQRPGDEDYDRYVYLVDLFRRLGYRDRDVFRESPFLVQDVLFNSILCRANRDLLEIAALLKEDTVEIRQWLDLTATAVARTLWCDTCEKFESIDLAAGDLIHTATAASFMPLFAVAASTEQAEVLYRHMDSVSFCALHQGNCFTIPNYDMTREDFDPRNYWRGPVWININWMLSQGLKSYGYREKSDAMKRDIIQLPVRFGFYEYYDSQSGQGYGSADFSWTSALFLDLLYDYYEQDPYRFQWLPWIRAPRLGKMVVLNGEETITSLSEKDPASTLMASIGELRNRFYDVERGRVDYEAMKDSTEYHRYQQRAARLQGFDPRSLTTEAQKKAFWINLYNVLVVHGIIETGITSSVREIPDFFTHLGFRIGPFTLSAADVEHGILRGNRRPPHGLLPPFRLGDPREQLSLERVDPRIHFALVCGSRSCAPIRFYQGETIDDQLDAAARNFINSSEVLILPEEERIFLSQIFNWYQRDFGEHEDIAHFLLKFVSMDFGKKQQVLHFLLTYLDRDHKARYLEDHMETIRVDYLFYDWNLNH